MAAPARPASSGKGVAVTGIKLPFEVIFASSSDDGFDARQLEAPSKPPAPAGAPGAGGEESKQQHIKGWQSAKFCPYPQTLVLRFPGSFDLRKIQILSHQSKIAHTVELYAGLAPPNADPSAVTDDSHAVYTRLGYLSLDSNDRSGFKARELKSVYVHARGQFLKLAIRKAHANALNQYAQVGIIAINVVGTRAAEGDPLPPLQAAAAAGGQQHVGSAGDSGGLTAQPGQQHTPLRSLVASLVSQYHCDEKTAEKMLELERHKSRAIAREDYDEAKRAKVHLDSLRELASRLRNLEREKVLAVEREDYDLAKQIKREIEALRGNAAHGQVQQQHQHQGPPPPQHQQQRSMSRDTSQKIVGNRRAQEEYAAQLAYEQEQAQAQHHQQQQPYHHAPPEPYDDDGGHSHAPPPGHYADQGHPDDDPNNGGMHQTSYDDGAGGGGGAGDERPIRPSKNSRPPVSVEEGGSPSAAVTRSNKAAPRQRSEYDEPEDDDPTGANSSSMPAPEPLSAVNRKDAEPLFDVFSEHAVQALYSRHWMLRQSALKDMTQVIASGASDVPLRDLFSAACRVLRKGLGDKVSQIFLAACQLLQVLLSSLAMQLRPEDVRSLLEPLVTGMMDKLSSSNVRERDGGMQVLSFLAFSPHVHPSLVPSNLLLPLKKKEKDSPLPLKCRAKLLLKCVAFYGLDEAYSLSLGTLVKFVQPHLLHRDAGVREGMFNLVCVAASLLGAQGSQRVLSLLKDLRPQTLETLQAKLDDVARGEMVFLKPSQPSLDHPYVSEQDPTHTLHGQVVMGGAPGVSVVPMAGGGGAAAPSAAAAAAANHHHQGPSPAKHQQQQQHRAPAHQQQQPHGHHGHGAAKAGGSPPAGKGGAHGGGGGGGKNMHSPPPPYSHAHGAHTQGGGGHIAEEEMSADLSGKCQFCGLEDASFTEEKLDLHYWQDCPILISCKQCEQVIEIPSLHEHLLAECEALGAYVECGRCAQPIASGQFAAHEKAAACSPPAPGMARCALCQTDVHRSDEGWKQHLLVDTCPKNTRQVKA